MTQPLVTMHNPFWSHKFADPFVLKVRGQYYAYATETEERPRPGSQVFPILTSTDLISWKDAGKALSALSADHFFYWAPEVTEYNGQFLLYYAVHRAEFSACIRVAVADQPEGPFVDSGYDLTGALVDWAIDPHVFRDQDGQWYLYITIEYTDPSQGLIGSGNAVCRMLNPFTLASPLTRVTPPSQPWQLFEAQRQAKGGHDWYTVEAPAVLRRGKRYYELFSGGCYYRDNYAMSYAIADTPMGVAGLQDTSWHDWQGREGNPLLVSGTDKLISPGHNSLVAGPNNVDLYMCYHAWLAPGEGRFPCLDRLFWHGDTLWTPAPTAGAQPAPASPRIRELFEHTELYPDWQSQDGSWQVEQGAVVQEYDTSVLAMLHSREQLASNWVLEVNLRCLAGQGTYGVVLREKTGKTARLAVTSEDQLMWTDQISCSISTIPLPPGTNLQAWHQLLLTLSGCVLTVQFDGVQLAEKVVEWTPDTFALMTEHCSAAFSGVTLTDHFRDVFLNERYTSAQLGWQEVEASDPSWVSSPESWIIQDDMLMQTNSCPGVRTLLKGDTYAHCEIGATIRISEQMTGGALGLMLWQSETEQWMIWLTQAQSEGCRLVIERLGEQPEIVFTQNLAAAFDLSSNHTLRIERSQNILNVYLDGPEIMRLDLPANACRMGLVTRNTAAVFQDIWLTGRNG